MADLIATEGYAQSIGGANISYTSNLGCTKSRAIALGCNVSGNYTYNQLVCQKDLSKATKVYTYNCTVHYSNNQQKNRFYTISDNSLIGSKKKIQASTTADCRLYTISQSTLVLFGNTYVNNSGTYNMTSGQTYYIIYVPIEGSLDPGTSYTELPPGNMLDNWREAGRFTYNSSILDQNNIKKLCINNIFVIHSFLILRKLLIFIYRAYQVF